MDRFVLMQTFARAVETGSFSAVARERRMSQPNVSRHIAALEQYLGTRLLHRSTRKLTLTPEGERYYAEVRGLLDAVDEAESNARGEDEPSGLLRIACPTALGRSHILPRIRAMLERYPALEIDLQIGDRFIDLVEEGVDAAIRIGALEDSALNARRIGTAERVCVASPEYLRAYSAPLVPEDLVRHNCIVYSLARSGSTWPFRTGDVTVRGRFMVNSPDGIFRAVLDGLGIAYAPVWLFEKELTAGRVAPLLLDDMGPSAPIHVVYPAKRLLSRRAGAFMDFIAEEFRVDPTLNEGALARLLTFRRTEPATASLP
ncbi:MAG TPA: LysR family transcriptional regulator [Steroidobacteraceae bacterium]|nr:LysR family transcriptional regulator [Steroidobacteraceae bacterium]